jgi:hypothetical protein
MIRTSLSGIGQQQIHARDDLVRHLLKCVDGRIAKADILAAQERRQPLDRRR